MKKLVFSVIATLFIGVVSISAQSMKPGGFSALRNFGFGKISSYAGPCVQGPGICIGSVDESSTFEVGISRVSESSISFAFSKEFYQNNVQDLKNGLYIGVSFSVPQDVTQKIGFNNEFIIAKGNYNVTLKDGYYVVSVLREK